MLQGCTQVKSVFNNVYSQVDHLSQECLNLAFFHGKLFTIILEWTTLLITPFPSPIPYPSSSADGSPTTVAPSASSSWTSASTKRRNSSSQTSSECRRRSWKRWRLLRPRKALWVFELYGCCVEVLLVSLGMEFYLMIIGKWILPL